MHVVISFHFSKRLETKSEGHRRLQVPLSEKVFKDSLTFSLQRVSHFFFSFFLASLFLILLSLFFHFNSFFNLVPTVLFVPVFLSFLAMLCSFFLFVFPYIFPLFIQSLYVLSFSFLLQPHLMQERKKFAFLFSVSLGFIWCEWMLWILILLFSPPFLQHFFGQTKKRFFWHPLSFFCRVLVSRNVCWGIVTYFWNYFIVTRMSLLFKYSFTAF